MSRPTAKSETSGEHVFRRVSMGPQGTDVVVVWTCACDKARRETKGISESEARGFARLDWSDHVRKAQRENLAG